MKSNFTKKEIEWIESFRECCAKVPDKLRLYSTDGDTVYICRTGTPSMVLCDYVNLELGCGTVVSDMHDED